MNEDFKKYRLRKGYAESSIKIQNSYLRKFTAWRTEKEIALQNIDYQMLLSFVSFERKKGSKPAALHKCLQAARIYLDYQMEKGTLKENPANRIKLKDKNERALLPPIEKETLDRIYNEFAGNQPKKEPSQRIHERDTVILGLLIFQGLDSRNLKRLTVKEANNFFPVL